VTGGTSLRYVLSETPWAGADKWEVVEKSTLGDRQVARNLTYDQAEQVMDYLNDVAPIIEHGCRTAPEGGTK